MNYTTLPIEDLLARCWERTGVGFRQAAEALTPGCRVEVWWELVHSLADCLRQADRLPGGRQALCRRLTEDFPRFQRDLLQRHPELAEKPPAWFEWLLLRPGMLASLEGVPDDPEADWDQLLTQAGELLRMETNTGEPFFRPVEDVAHMGGFLAWEPPYACFRCRCGREFEVRGFPELDDPDRLYLGFDGVFYAVCRDCHRR